MIDFHSSIDRVIRRWPTSEARAWVASFLNEAAQSTEILAVVALGSAVRPGVASEDIDLLVLHAAGVHPQWRAPIEVDLRGYDVVTMEEDLKTGADLPTWAVKHGVPLYDRSGDWRGIVDRWGDRLQLPDPAVAEKRAATALSQHRALEQVGDESAANEVWVSYLTHMARAALSRAGVFPASRPELAGQLRSIGHTELADSLASALADRRRLASESTAV